MCLYSRPRCISLHSSRPDKDCADCSYLAFPCMSEIHLRLTDVQSPKAPGLWRSACMVSQRHGAAAVQDVNTSLCTFYEIVAQNKDAGGQDPASNQQFFLQFITRYLHPEGHLRTRVTTLTRK